MSAGNDVPPKVWSFEKAKEGIFAGINKSTAGATHERRLPKGRHPMQLYSQGPGTELRSSWCSRSFWAQASGPRAVTGKKVTYGLLNRSIASITYLPIDPHCVMICPQSR